MNILGRARLAIVAAFHKAAEVWRTSSGYLSGFWPGTYNGRASFSWLSRNGFKRNPIGFRSIYLVAYQCAKIEVYARRYKADGTPEDDLAHPLNRLLRRPNPREGRLRWFLKLIGFLYLAGECYLYAQPRKTGGGKGQPIALWILPPDHVEEVLGLEEEIKEYIYTNRRGKPEHIPADRIHKIVTFDPTNDACGFPILGSAVDALQQMIDAANHNKNTLQNGGRHPGFFIAPTELGDTVFRRTKKEVQEQYKKDIEDQTPGLLEGGMKFDANGQTNKELDFNASDDRAMRKVAIAAGVDPALVGDSANKTYANFETAVKALLMLTVIPLLRFILDEIGPFLFAFYGNLDHIFAYNEDDIPELQEKQNEKWSRISDATGGPWLTPDEGRTEAGFDARGGAYDILYRPFNQVAIEALTDPTLSKEEREHRAKMIASLRDIDPTEAAMIVHRMLETEEPLGDGHAGRPPVPVR